MNTKLIDWLVSTFTNSDVNSEITKNLLSKYSDHLDFEFGIIIDFNSSKVAELLPIEFVNEFHKAKSKIYQAILGELDHKLATEFSFNNGMKGKLYELYPEFSCFTPISVFINKIDLIVKIHSQFDFKVILENLLKN